MRGFRKFLLRGNLIDLGLAVVVGVAFNAMVQALIRDLITPLIGAAVGQHDFSALEFHFHNSTFRYGNYLNAVISFAVIVAVVYYLLVAPADKLATLTERRLQTTERPCPECLSEIPVAAKRCKFCTAEVPPAESTDGPESPATLRDRITSRLRS